MSARDAVMISKADLQGMMRIEGYSHVAGCIERYHVYAGYAKVEKSEIFSACSCGFTLLHPRLLKDDEAGLAS